MSLILTPADSGARVVLNYLDNDGPGGLEPITNSGTLKPETQYTARLILTNQNAASAFKTDHIIDSTTVAGLPEKHQVFYAALDGLDLVTSYADYDANGNSIGFLNTFKTGTNSEGRIRITILHDPNKLGTNVFAGDMTNAAGKIDLQATLNVSIQHSL
ncbi:MAG: hypothetical protein ACPGU4_09460 [Flavobacteriales bacterium]